MNINKVKDEINKEKESYFEVKKDYSEFSKYLTFKHFFKENGVKALLAFGFAGLYTIPLIIYITQNIMHIPESDFFYTGFLIIFTVFILTIITPLFLMHFFNKFFSRWRFFTTKKDKNKHDKYIKNKIEPYFNELNISDKLLNILKVELSDEEFIQLMMDNESLKYKDVIKWLDKETKIQNIKELKRSVTLTPEQINEYKMANMNEIKTI